MKCKLCGGIYPSHSLSDLGSMEVEHVCRRAPTLTPRRKAELNVKTFHMAKTILKLAADTADIPDVTDEEDAHVRERMRQIADMLDWGA